MFVIIITILSMTGILLRLNITTAQSFIITFKLLSCLFMTLWPLVTDSLYHKRLSIDGRQLNLEVFDPCSEVRNLFLVLTGIYYESRAAAVCKSTHTV